MKVSGVEAYSIDKIVGNNIVFSKDGTVSFVYKLILPTKYSLSETNFDEKIMALIQAFKGFPKDSFIHKQDIFIKKKYDVSNIDRDSFLGKSFKEHFSDREYIDHQTILSFSLKGLRSLEKAYLKNPFRYDESLEKNDKEKLIQFKEVLSRSLNILDNIKKSKLIKPTKQEVKQIILNTTNGFETKGFYDLDFRDRTFGDDYNFDVFSFNRDSFFPDEIVNVTKSDLSLEELNIYEGFMDCFGETFPYNHIYNQIIYFKGKDTIIGELEESKREYSRYKSHSVNIKKKHDHLDDQIKILSEDSTEPIKFHANIILFEKDKDLLEKAKNKFKNLADIKGLTYYVPKKEILRNIFLGSIIGREKMLHRDFFFTSTLKTSVILFNQTSFSKDDEKGIYFNDRINQIPLKRDIWDEDKRRINARNSIFIANTGGGKSVSALRKITQLIDQGVNIVIVEFGKSFEMITRLNPSISKQVKYSMDTPLNINPFDIKGEVTHIKKSYLASIIFKCWRVKEYMADTHVLVSMEKILTHYYNQINNEHSFESFYNFVVEGGDQLLKTLEIEPEYFNIKSFKHNCSQFLEGGKYENVFKVTNEIESLSDKQLVVFELTEIKKDPFLVTLILLILQDTIDSNILSDRSKKGMLVFDEFAETQAIRDLYTDDDVLSTVAILFQKIRKENGAVTLIIQDIAQLPKNHYTDGILANTQILYVLPSNTSTYIKIKETMKLKESEYIQMCSIVNNYNSDRPYSEEFIRIGDKLSEVVRNELADEEFYAFQTDGATWKKLNDHYSEKTQDLKESIKYFVNQKKSHYEII